MSKAKTEIPQRWVTQAELEALVKKADYVYMWIDQDKYCRPLVLADKKTFVSNITNCSHRYDYRFLIDENYEGTIYVEQITRTEKQPTGGTVDTPGVNLAP